MWYAVGVSVRTVGGKDARLLVVIVEDDRDTAESIAEIADANGAEARIAFDGDSAMRLLRGECPDLLLLDLGIPDPDGCAVARFARARHGGQLRIVALTGRAEETYQADARDAGCDEVVIKPFDCSTVERLLETTHHRSREA